MQELMEQVKKYINKGEIVPKELLIEVYNERLKELKNGK